MDWVGHGGTTERDWRARPFRLRWNTDNITKDQINEASKRREVVAYTHLDCSGAHRKAVTVEDQERALIELEQAKAQKDGVAPTEDSTGEDSAPSEPELSETDEVDDAGSVGGSEPDDELQGLPKTKSARRMLCKGLPHRNVMLLVSTRLRYDDGP